MNTQFLCTARSVFMRVPTPTADSDSIRAQRSHQHAAFEELRRHTQCGARCNIHANEMGISVKLILAPTRVAKLVSHAARKPL